MSVTRQAGRPRVYVWPSGDPQDRYDLSADVVALSVSRQMGQPAGQMSVTVLPRTDPGAWTAQAGRGPARITDLQKLYRTLGPGSVISVGMDEDGGLGLGLIVGVRERSVFSGGAVQVGLQIEAQDLGRVMVVDRIILASLAAQGNTAFLDQIRAALGDRSPLLLPFAGAEGVFGPQVTPYRTDGQEADKTTVASFVGVGVDVIVRWLVENVPSFQIPLLGKALGSEGKRGGRLGDYVDTSRSITTWNDARVWTEALSTFQGSVWDFLRQTIDEDFYEIFLDYVPTGSAFPRPTLVVRPKPFDEPNAEFAPVQEQTGLTWDALRTLIDGEEQHDIPQDQILSHSLGHGEGTVASYYLVTSQNDLIGNDRAVKDGIAYPLIDTWAVKKFGLRPYVSRLSLLGGDLSRKIYDAEYTGEVFGEVREFRNRLFNWYRLASFYEEGSITVAGRDRFRIGDPVRLPERVAYLGGEVGMRYYCVGTSWEWTYGGHYSVTLRLTRGHNAGMVRALRGDIEADAPPSNPKHYAEG